VDFTSDRLFDELFTTGSIDVVNVVAMLELNYLVA